MTRRSSSRRRTRSRQTCAGCRSLPGSVHMAAEQLASGIIAEQKEIPSSTIRRGQITEHDFDKIVAFTRTMQQLPLYIDETGGLAIAQLSARARRLKRQRGLDFLVIDYLQ